MMPVPAHAAPAPAFGSQSTILLPGAAQTGMEEAEWALKPLAMSPAPGLRPWQRALGRLAALMPGMGVPSPPGPLLLSDPLSGSFPAAVHQPSCSQGSSPLLKANHKGTVPHPLLPQISVPKQPPRCNLESCERRATQGRDHSSKENKDAGNGGDPPPPPAIAVSGCLLGRRRTVWQRAQPPSARLWVPVGCGCPAGTATPRAQSGASSGAGDGVLVTGAI